MAVYQPAFFSEKHSPPYFLAFVISTKIEQPRNIIIMSIAYELNVHIYQLMLT